MKKQKKILIFDIELSPLIAYTWHRYGADVAYVKREQEPLTISWRWLGEKKTRSLARPNFNPGSDRRLVTKVWTLFNRADVIVGHNSKKFDVKKARAFFKRYALPPVSPFKQFDTCGFAKSFYGFGSNKLKDLAEYLGCPIKKLDPGGIKLWDACMESNAAAYLTMKKYNARDVDVTYWILKKFLPDAANHPAFFERADGCPTCGSTQYQSRGLYEKGAKTFTKYRCKKCRRYFYLEKDGKKIPVDKRGGRAL